MLEYILVESIYPSHTYSCGNYGIVIGNSTIRIVGYESIRGELVPLWLLMINTATPSIG